MCFWLEALTRGFQCVFGSKATFSQTTSMLMLIVLSLFYVESVGWDTCKGYDMVCV